jgi:hypothetical protein
MRRLALVLPLTALIACSLPATSFDSYRAKALDAAEETISQAQTAIFTAELSARGRFLDASVPVQLEDAEQAAAGAMAHFASVQPPDDRSEALRRSVLPLLQDTSDLIARMRFAARAGDEAELQRLRGSLEGPLRRLEAWVEPLA